MVTKWLKWKVRNIKFIVMSEQSCGVWAAWLQRWCSRLTLGSWCSSLQEKVRASSAWRSVSTSSSTSWTHCEQSKRLMCRDTPTPSSTLANRLVSSSAAATVGREFRQTLKWGDRLQLKMASARRTDALLTFYCRLFVVRRRENYKYSIYHTMNTPTYHASI